jgi:phosphopantetheine--protein transferase-like protein
MSSIRIGADLVQVDQVQAAIATFGDAYTRRVYTEREIQHCRGAGDGPVPERLAARFAAKEAAIKVLRPQVGVALTDIEVTIGSDGAPELAFSGTAATRGEELDLAECSLSLTHDGAYAAAVFVALTGNGPDVIPSRTEDPTTVQETKLTERTDAIRNVLAKHGRLSVPITDLSDDTNLYGAGLTSHATVNVMLALENEFDTEFPVSLLRRSTFESIDNLNAALEDVLGSEG